jgi:hypothetical protein
MPYRILATRRASTALRRVVAAHDKASQQQKKNVEGHGDPKVITFQMK